ncbi:hypothetical protein D3C78_883540 [compost metagenome]
MFELELHDVIPYLFSISLLCSLAYAYASHLNVGEIEYWKRSLTAAVSIIILPRVIIRVVPIQHWLARKVKRKESPDDDISACKSSFVSVSSYKRGGFQCEGTMYSLL